MKMYSKTKKSSAYKPSSKQERNKMWEAVRQNYAWHSTTDYRLHPEEYKVGKGEQGVLICEPYKSEILPYWRFKTPEIAHESSCKIYMLFQNYLCKKDFVGADMSRKFLQMGYTRSRRYANHSSGRKYNKETGEELPITPYNGPKAESARIFFEMWKAAEEDPLYKTLKHEWKSKYG